jgi:predicted metal-dependent hydrolase
MQVILDNQKFEVIHRSNKRIKRIGIAIENKDEIIVKTPLKFKVHHVRDIVLDNKDWILRAINKVPSKNMFDFVCGGLIPFMGNNYPLELIENEKIKNVKFDFDGERFICKHNPDIKEYEDFFEGMKKFYKKVASKYIDPIFDEVCFKTKLYPQNITYRYAKRRWGSCSYKNDISINYMLLQFPQKVIEYVVLHELCHIEEKNHSKRFYNLLSLYMEDYKVQENILKHKKF